MTSFEAEAGLTDGEKKMLSFAWAFMATPPTIDLEKLAQALGYTNPRSIYPVLKTAREKLNKAKAKLSSELGDAEEGGSGAPGTPSKAKATAGGAGTPASRKRKAPAGRKGGASATPSKRGKQGSASGAQGAAKEASFAYDDDGDYLEDGEA
ncbi:hypothetical protein SLS62_007927 [Diatrype stigma]|uniref:Uncharacterized protein n=1 Tax=Diatrype stigma TaxID=117547 RepID=A0AAN9ULZ1_9PEZI